MSFLLKKKMNQYDLNDDFRVGSALRMLGLSWSSTLLVVRSRLFGNGGCGGHPHNEVRKIQVPRVKVANNTSPCQILGFYTVVKVASHNPRVGKPT